MRTDWATSLPYEYAHAGGGCVRERADMRAVMHGVRACDMLVEVCWEGRPMRWPIEGIRGGHVPITLNEGMAHADGVRA